MGNIIRDNITCLEQGINLLSQVEVADYTAADPQAGSGSLGAHIRHNLDHYQCLLEQRKGGAVNYDQRSRDASLEHDPESAISLMKDFINLLNAIGEGELDSPLRIRMDCGSDEEDNWSDSTLRRELQFLISHTIHHYALIGVLCRLRGIQPEADFGVAPSTLKFRSRQGLAHS